MNPSMNPSETVTSELHNLIAGEVEVSGAYAIAFAILRLADAQERCADALYKLSDSAAAAKVDAEEVAKAVRDLGPHQ